MAGALLRAARLGSSWVPERPAPSQAARRPALEALPQEDEATSELAASPTLGGRSCHERTGRSVGSPLGIGPLASPCVMPPSGEGLDCSRKLSVADSQV